MLNAEWKSEELKEEDNAEVCNDEFVTTPSAAAARQTGRNGLMCIGGAIIAHST